MTNVIPISGRPKGNGNGGKFDDRLRTVETAVAKIETKMENVATREDVLKVRLWVVGGVVGGILTAVAFALAAFRLFM